MKTLVTAAVVLAITAGGAMAYPSKSYNHGNHRPQITAAERAAIARSQWNLNALERRARADGRITAFERMQIRFAQARHNQLVKSAWRS
jgi:uncharacterized membrane protein YebE (DUF533 family)